MCRNPWWLSSKETACNAGDVDLIPGSGRYTEEGNDNLLQYSCLGNSMDRGGWQATVCAFYTSPPELCHITLLAARESEKQSFSWHTTDQNENYPFIK